MHRTFPRLVLCGAFVALLVPLLHTQSLAQTPAPPPVPCDSTFASSDQANQKYGCAVRYRGTTNDTYRLDGVYEAVQITGRCGSTCGEWYWVFDNVPAGIRTLTFKGHSLQNAYTLEYRLCDPSTHCPSTPDQLPCPTNVYAPADTIRTGPDQIITAPLPSNGNTSRVCVLVEAQGKPGSCSVQDQVYVDYLEISTCPEAEGPPETQ